MIVTDDAYSSVCIPAIMMAVGVDSGLVTAGVTACCCRTGHYYFVFSVRLRPKTRISSAVHVRSYIMIGITGGEA